MELAQVLKKLAIAFATKNSLVVQNEIVETVWGNWKKPHKVKIYSIGAGLSLSGKLQPEFGMTYYAIRFFANGRPRDTAGCGIALTNFTRDDGTIWTETHEVINHCAYRWVLPRGNE